MASDELLPPPELAPAPMPEHLTMDERIAVWVDLMDACDAMVMAGLRREIGPEGDLRAAFRRWHAAQREEHDQMIVRWARRLAGEEERDDG